MLVDKIAKYQVYLYVVVAIIVLFLLYKFSNNLMILFGFKDSKDAKKDEKEYEKDLAGEINDLYDNGVRASYPVSTYNEWANGLESAMDNAGTDNDYVFRVFGALKNQLDFNLLTKSFGIRKKGIPFVTADDWNLTQWLVSEMSDSERKELNKTLVKNKIKPVF